MKSMIRVIPCVARKPILYFALFGFFLCLHQYAGLAQPIFSEGKVITMDGDTLRGWIGEMGSYRNNNKCIFRSATVIKQQVFQPNDIRGYLIENRRYFESRMIPNAEGINTNVFAEIIVEGTVSLLKVREVYFLLDEQGELQRIPYYSNYRYANIERSDLDRLQSEWLRFLNDLSQSCAAMSEFFEERENLLYEEYNLVRIINAYNECKGASSVEYGADLPLVVFDVGPAVSFSRTNVPFVADQPLEFQYLTESNFNVFGIEWSMPVYLRSTRRLTNFGFYIEPFFRSYQLDRDLQYSFQRNPHTAYYNFSSEWMSVGTPFAFRYTVPNLTPYLSIQIGTRLDFLFNRRVALSIEEVITENGIDYITYNSSQPFELANSQIGLTAQINLTNNWIPLAGRWEVSLGANWGSGITDFDDSTVAAGLPLATQTRTIFLKTAFLW